MLPWPRRTTLPAVAAAMVLSAAIAGCSSGPPGDRDAPVHDGPRSVSRPDRDGPEPNPPPNLEAVPDAEPKVEPIRAGGPNKPYAIDGERYVPVLDDAPFTQRGLASWYGRKFHGARTASGERYDMYAMTAAHPTLPIPSYARVTNPANGRTVVVRINDRGPFHSSRIIDLSYTAALKLDVLRGVRPVDVQHLTVDDIRSAARRRGAPSSTTVVDATVASRPPPAAVTQPVESPKSGADAADEGPERTAGRDPGIDASPSPPGPAADPVETPAEARVDFWVQLGAFRAREGAIALREQLAAGQAWLAPWLAVFRDAPWYRLQAGPYRDRDAARAAVDRLRPAKIDALVILRPR